MQAQQLLLAQGLICSYTLYVQLRPALSARAGLDPAPALAFPASRVCLCLSLTPKCCSWLHGRGETGRAELAPQSGRARVPCARAAASAGSCVLPEWC